MRSSFPAMPQLDSALLLLAGGHTPYAFFLSRHAPARFRSAPSRWRAYALCVLPFPPCPSSIPLRSFSLEGVRPMRSSFPAMPQLDSAPLLLAGGRTPYAFFLSRHAPARFRSAPSRWRAYALCRCPTAGIRRQACMPALSICAWLIVYHSTYPDTYRRFVSIRILEVWTAVSSQYPVSLL